MLPVTQIDTFYNGLTSRHRDTINAAAGGTFMKMRLEECYVLIENMTAHHNDWDTSTRQSESSSSTTSSFDPEIVALKAEMAEINKNIMRVLQLSFGQLSRTARVESKSKSKQSKSELSKPKQELRKHSSLGEQPRRNQFFQRASHGPNPPPAYQAPAYQAPSYQAPVHQPPIPQPQVVTTNEFTNYMKANNAILKNMQTNMTSLTNSNLELKNMFGQFMKMNTASSSGSGTLLGNTITNPKEDLKGITTRKGTAYQGPTIPTTSSSLSKVVERETEVTKDTVPPTNNGSTKDIQPSVVHAETPLSNSEPVIAPIIKPVVAPVIVDFDADPRVPIILGISFLKTKRALIDVFEGESTLHVGKEAITFNLDQTSRYSANYNDMTANQIDVIGIACEEYSQEILGFSNVIASGNPTP
nr:reverse transcriptase domain-containing protein [Tanacetum cinerariifolium]